MLLVSQSKAHQETFCYWIDDVYSEKGLPIMGGEILDSGFTSF